MAYTASPIQRAIIQNTENLRDGSFQHRQIPRVSATKEHSFADKPAAASRRATVFADDRMIDPLDRELDDDPYMCAYLRARFDKYKRVDCVLMRKAYAACNYAGVRAVAFVKPTAARENRRRGRQQMRAIPTLLGVQCASLTLTEVEERGSVGRYRVKRDTGDGAMCVYVWLVRKIVWCWWWRVIIRWGCCLNGNFNGTP